MRPEILFPLFAPVDRLKGVGPKVAPLLHKLAGPLVRALLALAPTGVIVRRRTTSAEAVEGETAIFEVVIDRLIRPGRPGVPIKVRASDDSGFVHLVWFHGSTNHIERLAPPGERRLVSGKVERFGGEVQIPHPDHIIPLERAEELPIVEPVYPQTQGLTSRQIRRLVESALALAPELPEWQDPAWRARQGWPDWRAALLAALPFTLTGAQSRALAEIRADLASGEQMGRLLQGDVGSGKTAVAALALADAVSSGFQAALMAPTEILARQHALKLIPMFAAAGVEAVLLTGRDSAAERRDTLAALADGRAALAIGTHALFQEAVTFRNLGLAVIDEQHRFGVSERQRLQAKGDLATGGVHLLTMSATPIPRTLELTQYGDLDVSRLHEKPPGRTPVTTAVLPQARIGDVVRRLGAALDRGAQAYWICPLVAESEAVDLAAAEARAADLTRALRQPIGLAHGRMPGAERAAVMDAFARGELPLLVATTVVEVGVDVPNASIMVIEHADRFGLAQLHQLRGRVGRGARASACTLLYGGEDAGLGETARERLEILRGTEDGFEIAEADFRLRGGGDPLGLRQSGFPAYRFVDPVRHRALMQAAFDDARLILGRYPDLSSPRGAALRVLEHLFDWRPDRPGAD
ncbi:MAG: ATP-dependent DNA helicase RecG [Brevundimonas sp.]